MSTWHRVSLFAFAAAFLALSSPALAQSPEQQAEKLNEEGKKLWAKKDVPGAVQKFRQAVVLSPKAKYYYNLCYGLHQIARYKESLQACRAVATAEEPTERMRSNAEKVIADIKTRAPAAFQEPDGGDGGDGFDGGDGGDGSDGSDGSDGGDGGDGGDGFDGGDGGDGFDGGDGGDGGDGFDGGTGGTGGEFNGGAGGRPLPGPIAGLEGSAPEPDVYNWSLGVDLGFVGNGVGDVYAGVGVLTKFHASYLFAPAARIGVQGYAGISRMGSADEGAGIGFPTLEIIDLGGALFKHTQFRNMYVTPALGAHISVMSPDAAFAAEESLATVGVHAEAGISWLFGPEKRHVINLIPSLSVYLPAQDTGGLDPAAFGLDRAGATFSITLGYTLRFLTPFGSSPFFTLE